MVAIPLPNFAVPFGASADQASAGRCRRMATRRRDGRTRRCDAQGFRARAARELPLYYLVLLDRLTFCTLRSASKARVLPGVCLDDLL
jgi:hypothetical protein